MPGPGPMVLGSSVGIAHRLGLVLGSRLVIGDRAVVDLEPAGAGDAHSRRAAAVWHFRALTRRLAGAETPSDVGNGHLFERSGYGSFELSPPEIASHSCRPEQLGRGGSDFTEDVSNSYAQFVHRYVPAETSDPTGAGFATSSPYPVRSDRNSKLVPIPQRGHISPRRHRLTHGQRSVQTLLVEGSSSLQGAKIGRYGGFLSKR